MEQRRKYILIGAALGIVIGWFLGGLLGYSTIGIALGALFGIYAGNHLAKGRGY